MRTALTFAVVAITISAGMLRAQAPAQPTVQAVAPAAAVPAQGQASNAATLQALQQVKAANDEMLKRQAATLAQLEEIEKAAEQIRILTQRS